MPTTSPCVSRSGPPESPATTSAVVSIMDVSVSDDAEPSSAAVTDAVSEEIVPAAAESAPVPSALPTAVTTSPTAACSRSTVMVLRPDAPVSCRRATSSVASLPTTVAW